MCVRAAQSESTAPTSMPEYDAPVVELLPSHGLVRASIAVDRPVDDAWRALTDPSAVRQWLGTIQPLQPGGPAHLDFGDGDFFTLHVHEVRPPGALDYTWRFLGIGPEAFVQWRCVPEGDGCLVAVTDRESERTPSSVTELGEGWADFLMRLEHFLSTGERSRYTWRPSFDASIELTSPPDVAYEALFTYGVGGWYTPVNGTPCLAPGIPYCFAYDREPLTFQFAHIEWKPPTGVRLEIDGPGWGRPTVCDLRFLPRSCGALLQVHHGGWDAIDATDRERRNLRKRFASFWIDTLVRVADAVERSRHDMPVVDPPMSTFWSSPQDSLR
jgi:uncharacterized protein YndB with AHSA1/START domain